MIRNCLVFLSTVLLLASLASGAVAQEPAPPPDEDEPTRIEIDIRQVLEQAREAMRERDYEKAVGLYQIVLRFVPDSRVARIEFSFALAALGEQERAARLLRDLDTDGLNPEVIDLVNRIIGPDRLNFFFVPEFFLDSNISGQTKSNSVRIGNTIVQLNDDARGASGYGYGVTLGASYRLTDFQPRTTVTAGVSARDYESSDDDEQSAFGSLSARFDITRQFALTPSLSAVYRYDAWDPREFELGGGLAGAVAIGPVRNTLAGRYRRVSGQANDRGSRLNRDEYEISNTVSFGFDSIAFRVEPGFTYEDWENLDQLDQTEIIGEVDMTFLDIPWVVPTIGGAFTYRDFRNADPLFGFERLDREWEGSIEFLFRDIDVFGSNPFIRYEYTNQDSNIPLVDFDRHEVSIGIRAIVF